VAERYYPDSDQTPQIVKLVLYRVLLFVAEVLYPSEYDPSNPDCRANKRVMASSMQGGNDFHMRRSVEANALDPIQTAVAQFDNFMQNDVFPFTAYSVAEEQDGEIKNWLAQSGTVWIDEIGRYGGAIHRTITFPMVTFFAREADYHTAINALRFSNSVLTRLDVPIVFNKELDAVSPQKQAKRLSKFPIDISIEISQGDYAYDFQAYLTKNKIWDVKHDIKIRFYDLNFGAYLADQTINDIMLNLWEMHTGAADLLTFSTTIDSQQPVLTSSNPANGATAVVVNPASIDFVFSQPMDMAALVKIATVSPAIEADVSYSDDHLTLSYVPQENLLASTTYTFTFPGPSGNKKGTTNYWGRPVADSIVVGFSTAP